jgi:hypothetical protein
MSAPIPRFPDKKNESGDHARYDKHPVLAFETQNREMIDEKMHRFRPAFMQDKRFCGKNILFLYFYWSDLAWFAHSRQASATQKMLQIMIAD